MIKNRYKRNGTFQKELAESIKLLIDNIKGDEIDGVSEQLAIMLNDSLLTDCSKQGDFENQAENNSYNLSILIDGFVNDKAKMPKHIKTHLETFNSLKNAVTT